MLVALSVTGTSFEKGIKLINISTAQIAVYCTNKNVFLSGYP